MRTGAKTAVITVGTLVAFSLVVVIIIIICGHAAPCRVYRPHKARFPLAQVPTIDLVVTWVDGHDPKVVALKQKYQALEDNPHPGATAPYRMESYDELKYLLRSVCRYAPWINKVHILVSHHQRPPWLVDSHVKLHVVNDTEVIPTSHLPTFNSHALEVNMHKIPGLAEHYIYCCDDMMFGNHTPPSSFFNRNGTLAMFLSPTSVRPVTDDQVKRSMHQHAWRNNYRALQAKSCYQIPQYLPSHQMLLTSKSLGKRMDEKFPDLVEATSSSKFRHADNIHPLGLQLYNGICEGVVMPAETPPSMKYMGWSPSLPGVNKRKLRLISQTQPQLICFNNIRGSNVQMWIDFAEEYFKGKCEFEK